MVREVVELSLWRTYLTIGAARVERLSSRLVGLVIFICFTPRASLVMVGKTIFPNSRGLSHSHTDSSQHFVERAGEAAR